MLQEGTGEWTWFAVEGQGRLEREGAFGWSFKSDGLCNLGGGNGRLKAGKSRRALFD